REDAGAFERDVDAEVLPGKLGGILFGGDLDLAIAKADRVALDLDLAREAAVHRVVAQEVRIGFNRPEIVERDDLDILAAGLRDGAQNVAADAAKSVDGDPDGHAFTPFLISSCPGARASSTHLVENPMNCRGEPGNNA